MSNEISLCSLCRGQRGYISYINDDCTIKERLRELGFTVGAEIHARLDGWGMAIRAYEVRGALIALRRDDAAQIRVII